MKRFVITVALAFGLVATANAEYWRSSSGEVVKSGFGECVVNIVGTWDENNLDDMLACGDAREESKTLDLPRDAITFDFDSSELSDAALEVIENARGAIPEDAVIAITGHTDAVGTPDYNYDLGKRRANAVHAKLIGRAIRDVVVTSEGESDLLVPTQAKERSNRRVEVEAAWDVIIRMDRPAK